METQGHLYCEQDDEMHVSPQCKVIKKRALVEVFSVRIIDKTGAELQIDRIGGFILLKGSDKNHVLYENPFGERGPQFDSMWYLTLVGPECGVQVEDAVVIHPWFFHKYSYSCDMSKGCTLWKKDACPRFDQLIRKGIKRYFGLMEVDFAVYSDAVEARLEVIVSDFNCEGLLQPGKSVKVYGTIKASNGTLIQPEAKSSLFSITHQDCMTLSLCSGGEAGISLPLTRNVTAIPRESALVVDFCLSLSSTVGPAMFDHTVVGSAVFDPTLRSRNVEEKIIDGPHNKVKVKVVWST